MIVLLNSESLDWFLASRLIILYLSHAYTNLSEPLWLKKIVGFTNKEAEKRFWLVIYKLQQGSLAVLGNFVNTKEVIPSVSWNLARFRHTPSSPSPHLLKNIVLCMKRIHIVELLCFQQHTGKGSSVPFLIFSD